MASPFPKPESQKVGRTKPTHDWINLPRSGNHSSTPALPVRADDGVWSSYAAERWRQLWSTPESLMWTDAGSHDMASLYLRLLEQLNEGKITAALLAGMKDCQRQLGLTQKDKLSLRWRIVADNFADPRFTESETDARPLASVKPISHNHSGIIKRNPPNTDSEDARARRRNVSYEA